MAEMEIPLSGYSIEIKPCLIAWINVVMPNVGGVGKVRIRCCDKLPFEWLPGFLPNAQGITLWNTIYLKNRCCPIDPSDDASVELLLHELVHIEQFRRGYVSFPLQYLVDLARVGYWKIPAEVEARRVAAELMERYKADCPCRS